MYSSPLIYNACFGTSASPRLRIGVGDFGNCWDTSGHKEVPMNKKYIVRLSDEERGVCQEIIKYLKGSSQKFRRAQILLKADADGPAWSDVRIADAFNCRVQTIENVRKRLVTGGFELA